MTMIIINCLMHRFILSILFLIIIHLYFVSIYCILDHLFYMQIHFKFIKIIYHFLFINIIFISIILYHNIYSFTSFTIYSFIYSNLN